MTHARTEFRMVDPNELVPYGRNSKRHPAEQIALLKRSIERFGFLAPVVLGPNNQILAGHARVKAAIAAGLEEVPAVLAENLTAAERRAYVIADNRLAEKAEWDTEMLAEELSGLLEDDQDMFELAGFDQDELADMLQDDDAHIDAGDHDDVPEPPVDPITRPGDLILLGDHRLLCGDCRNIDDVAKLIGDVKINVAFTSPPYASQRKYDESSGFNPIPPDEFVEWFEPVQANVRAHLAGDGSWFINIKPCADGLDTSLYVFDMVCAHVREWGWHFATEFCWERSGVPKSVTQRFKNQFEPVYQFALGRWKMRPESVMHESDSVPIAIGKGAGNTGWGNERQGKGGDAVLPNDHEPGMAYPGNRLPKFNSESMGHTAAFPVGLPLFFIKAFSDKRDAILDPFAGSGTTLIAAEQLGRRCFGMEISPAYCDVIVQRWEALTGEQAVRPERKTAPA